MCTNALYIYDIYQCNELVAKIDSLGSEGWHFLTVWVSHFLNMLQPLLLLGNLGADSDSSLCLFHFTVSKYLLSALMLLLHGPQSLLLGLCLLHHVCLSLLESSLVHDLVSLRLGESLKVIWLDSVGTKHRSLSLGILRHKLII